MASGLERFDDAVVMTRVMFPYIGFISLVSLSAGVLNTWKRFAVPAATPVLLNLAMIGARLAARAACSRAPASSAIYALAVGVMLGGVLQLAVQVPALARVGCLPRIAPRPGARSRAAWRHPGVRTMLRQMAPALLGVSVAQLSMLINTQIASHQGVGAVSWLIYADRLMEFPTALLGVALGAVLIPQLSAAQGARRRRRLLGHARLGPAPGAAAGAAVRGRAARLPRGRWSRRCSSAASSTPLAVAKTALALRGYGVGLLGLIGVKILAPGLLCAPGHPHAGDDRRRRARR